MPRITEVVKYLLIINVVMYFGTYQLMGDSRQVLAMHFPLSDGFQPFQIVSHMFMHADQPMHLFFNMFGLYMFGTVLEQLWGPKKFLFYYLFTALGAAALYTLVQFMEYQYVISQMTPDAVAVVKGSAPRLFNDDNWNTLSGIWNGRVWGASGAIFGLLAGYAMKFPNNIIGLIFPPIQMKAKYFVLIYGAFELFMGVSSFNTGIAHFAHLGGALFGFLLILYWRKKGMSV